MILEGKSVKLGDNVNTDVILPGVYLTLTKPEELAKHAMEGIDPNFYERAREGVVIVAGKNFGCGSSREHAPIALKYAGVKSIIAKSFARIFFRNAINVGLPLLETSEAYDAIDNNDQIRVNLEEGVITNTSKNITIKAKPLPEPLLDLIVSGGLIPKLKKRFMKSKNVKS